MKRFINYFKSFTNIFSKNSTKLLTLLICSISGGFLSLVVIPFCLIWDVVDNGYITTNLYELGVFLLCIAGFICGAGYNVKVPGVMKYDKLRKEREKNCNIEEEEDKEEE